MKVYKVKLRDGVGADLCATHIAKLESEGEVLERGDLAAVGCLVCECMDGEGGLKAFIDGYVEDSLEWRRERANELGMGLGVEAFNDAMGWGS